VKRFEDSLARMSVEEQGLFTKMRDSHLRSIAACESLIRKI
jgi:hypothetical protein